MNQAVVIPSSTAKEMLVRAILCAALFCAQFAFMGLFPVFAPRGVSESLGASVAQFATQYAVATLLLGALPAFALAYAVARFAAPSLLARSTRSPILWIVSWSVMFCLGWLALYAWLAGPDVSTWSGQLLSQPPVWYGFVACALGLTLGSKAGRVA